MLEQLFPWELLRSVCSSCWRNYIYILDLKSPASEAWLLLASPGWVCAWCADSLAAPCCCSTLLPYPLKHPWVFLSLLGRTHQAPLGQNRHDGAWVTSSPCSGIWNKFLSLIWTRHLVGKKCASEPLQMCRQSGGANLSREKCFVSLLVNA